MAAVAVAVEYFDEVVAANHEEVAAVADDDVDADGDFVADSVESCLVVFETEK